MKHSTLNISNAKHGVAQIKEVRHGLNLVWSSFNPLDWNPYYIGNYDDINISGTTTTLLDYNGGATTYDMSNPSAATQPIYTASDADFNGFPSLTYDGVDDYLSKPVTNFRNSDSSGMFVGVFKFLGGNDTGFLQTGSDTSARYLQTRMNTNAFRFLVRHSGGNNSFRGSTDITLETCVVAWGSRGSSYFINVNGDFETLTPISGGDTGVWLNQISPLDTLSTGAILDRGSVYPSNIKVGFGGYFPYVSDSEVTDLVVKLKAKYKD